MALMGVVGGVLVVVVVFWSLVASVTLAAVALSTAREERGGCGRGWGVGDGGLVRTWWR